MKKFFNCYFHLIIYTFITIMLISSISLMERTPEYEDIDIEYVHNIWFYLTQISVCIMVCLLGIFCASLYHSLAKYLLKKYYKITTSVDKFTEHDNFEIIKRKTRICDEAHILTVIYVMVAAISIGVISIFN